MAYSVSYVSKQPWQSINHVTDQLHTMTVSITTEYVQLPNIGACPQNKYKWKLKEKESFIILIPRNVLKPRQRLRGQ